MKEEGKNLVRVIFLTLLIDDLINMFSFKTQWFLHLVVLVIIGRITNFMFYKGIITKNWWKKFIPFYILIIIMQAILIANSVKPLTLYFIKLITMLIIFILLLIKYLKKKRTENVANS